MARFPQSFQSAQPLDYASGVEAGAVARFFNAVYAWMSVGMAVTALVAWYVSQHYELVQNLGAGIIVVFIAQLVLVGVISAAVQRINAAVATALFVAYAALNGFTLSVLFLVYTHAVLASAFVITAGMFGTMSLFGFLTGKDLSAWGSFLFMGLVGVVIASVVSIFWHNTMLQVLINYVGVAVFVGLTAYDTQKLKTWAIQTSGDAALAARLSVSGALTLYLDFLNMFIFIVRILGDRR